MIESRTLTRARILNIRPGETKGGDPKVSFSLVQNPTDRNGNQLKVWTNAVVYGTQARTLIQDHEEMEGSSVSVTGHMEYWMYNDKKYDRLVVTSMNPVWS
mgnify:CR=1 FL=1